MILAIFHDLQISIFYHQCQTHVRTLLVEVEILSDEM